MTYSPPSAAVRRVLLPFLCAMTVAILVFALFPASLLAAWYASGLQAKLHREGLGPLRPTPAQQALPAEATESALLCNLAALGTEVLGIGAVLQLLRRKVPKHHWLSAALGAIVPLWALTLLLGWLDPGGLLQWAPFD